MYGERRLSMRKKRRNLIVIELEYLQSQSRETRVDGLRHGVGCKKSCVEWVNGGNQKGWSLQGHKAHPHFGISMGIKVLYSRVDLAIDVDWKVLNRFKYVECMCKNDMQICVYLCVQIYACLHIVFTIMQMCAGNHL